MKEIRNAYKILVENPGRKRPLGRPRRRREDSIKIDVTQIGCKDVELIYPPQCTVGEFRD